MVSTKLFSFFIHQIIIFSRVKKTPWDHYEQRVNEISDDRFFFLVHDCSPVDLPIIFFFCHLCSFLSQFAFRSLWISPLAVNQFQFNFKPMDVMACLLNLRRRPVRRKKQKKNDMLTSYISSKFEWFLFSPWWGYFESVCICQPLIQCSCNVATGI